MTVILAEHKMEKLAVYADRIALLHEGALIAYDTPARVFSREDLAEYGVEPPVYTRVCRELGFRMPDTGVYPVALEEAQIARLAADQGAQGEDPTPPEEEVRHD